MTFYIGTRTPDLDRIYSGETPPVELFGRRPVQMPDAPAGNGGAGVTDSEPGRVLTTRQEVAGAVLVAAITAGLEKAPVVTALALNALMVAYFTAANLFKLWLVRRSLDNPCAVSVSDEELACLDDRGLPVYTILVPLYHEAEMIPQLVAGISRLDYPAEKLDVKLLLEADDHETMRAVRAVRLPRWFEVLTIPDLGPRGKPRACNAGLARSRGDYLVIYDAEDRPEPDQLRKVVAAFRKAPSNQICIQAKLNYFNRSQNLLTRWFTAEYSVWFDQLLPGLQSLDVAMPLGGTSNHFVTQRLRDLGGWNAFNVTEDAELGIRVYMHGWKTAVLDSTTYEEANSRVGNWIRQRSRWVKGYVQTYLFQMRHPVRLYRVMGPKAFFAFHLFFGAGTICLLVNPLYLLLTIAWFGAHLHAVELLFPGPLLYICAASFVLGNIAFVLAVVSGCYQRGHYEDVKWALLAPLYWLMMSVAAWKGVLQLLYKSFYWEKTTHGFCRLPAELDDGSRFERDFDEEPVAVPA